MASHTKQIRRECMYYDFDYDIIDAAWFFDPIFEPILAEF